MNEIRLILGRNWILFNATVYEIERLFKTKYHYYEHEVSGDYRIACDEYHLPENVRQHVDFAVSSEYSPCRDENISKLISSEDANYSNRRGAPYPEYEQGRPASCTGANGAYKLL